MARGSFGTLDGRMKNKNTDHSDEERIASGCYAHRGCLHHVGVQFARMDSLGRRRAVWIDFGRPCQLGHEPSVRPSFVVGPWGRPIMSASGSHVGLSRAAARQQQRESRLLSTVDAAGLFNAGASIRSSLPVTRVVGLVLNGGLRSPE